MVRARCPAVAGGRRVGRIERGQARNAGTNRDGTAVTHLDALRRLGLVAWMVALLAAADPAGNPAEIPAGNADSETPPPVDEQAASEPAGSEDAPSARARYNLGLEDLENGDFAGAAEAFLGARDDARGDPVLRYRSAFNLGLALAAQADGSDGEALEETIETLRSSAAWFSDAARLAPEEDEDARVNLEIVLRRIQQLADQLNRTGTSKPGSTGSSTTSAACATSCGDCWRTWSRTRARSSGTASNPSRHRNARCWPRLPMS